MSKITLTAGRAHLKHTEGGDFRQATYRAVRQGLRTAARAGKVQLLEPWYALRLELPADRCRPCDERYPAHVRRDRAAAGPRDRGRLTVLTGRAPVAGAARLRAGGRGLHARRRPPAGHAPRAMRPATMRRKSSPPQATSPTPTPKTRPILSFAATARACWSNGTKPPPAPHVSSGLGRLAPDAGGGEAADGDETPAARRRAAAYRGTLEQDKELLRDL